MCIFGCAKTSMCGACRELLPESGFVNDSIVLPTCTPNKDYMLKHMYGNKHTHAALTPNQMIVTPRFFLSSDICSSTSSVVFCSIYPSWCFDYGFFLFRFRILSTQNEKRGIAVQCENWCPRAPLQVFVCDCSAFVVCAFVLNGIRILVRSGVS